MFNVLLIAATILTPPITSEPCTIIQTPSGTMCAPKVAKVLKIYGEVIRTGSIDVAKRICFDRAGAGCQVWETKNENEYLCVKEVD